MSYVQSFKKFANAEKKASEEVVAGANPAGAEQSTPATQAVQTTQPGQTAAPAIQPKIVEADPAVVAARSALAAATSNRDKMVSAKETELEKLKADQAIQVNNANTALNSALQKAATSK
jgi:hypothetical protein